MTNTSLLRSWLLLALSAITSISLSAQQQPAMYYSGDMNSFDTKALTYLVTDYWTGNIQAPADDASSQFLFRTGTGGDYSEKWARGAAVAFGIQTDWFWNALNDGTIPVTANKFYSFTVKDVADGANSDGIVIETDDQPQSITMVGRTSTTVAPGQAQTITATTTVAPPAGQGIYLRYTKDNYASSTVMAMSAATATTFTATIPAAFNTSGSVVSYYVFSSGSGLPLSGADADRFTINLNNNSNSNYNYTVAENWATIQAGDWSNAATWAANQVPVTGADVRIAHAVTLNVDATVRNLTITGSGVLSAQSRTLTFNNSGVFTVDGTFNRNTSKLNFLGSGTINGSPTFHEVAVAGGVNFGTSALANTLTINTGGFVDSDAPTFQTGSTVKYNSGVNYDQALEWPQTGGPTNITIANGTRVLLQGFRALGSSGTLFLDSGRLVLNGRVFQNQGTVTRTASTTDNFIECAASKTSNGFYEQNLVNGETKTFAVGVNNEYAPVTITRTVGTNNALFAVRVFPGAWENGTGTTTYPDGHVQLSWEITETGATTLASTVQLQWNGSTESSAFDRGSALISRSSMGSQYTAVPGVQSRSGSNPYTQSVTGITGFSIFAVLNNPILPVEWLSFRGKAHDSAVELTWQTATERNSDYFAVQRQLGTSWETIGKVDAAGNSDVERTYTFLDDQPRSGVNYYRLRQMDFDGSEDYSQIVAVAHHTETPVRIYPNPTRDQVLLSQPAARVMLYDAAGRWLQTITNVTPATPIDLRKWPAGHYRLQLLDGNGTVIATPAWVQKQ